MNYSDSERVASALQKLGFKKAEKPSEANLYLFNTCSIRQKGEDRVYGKMRTLGEWKKHNPSLLLALTGCMVRKTSTRNTEKKHRDKLFSVLPMLDFVFKITDAHRLGEIIEQSEHQPFLEEDDSDSAHRLDYLTLNPDYTSSFQALVPIQIGCDKYCTYCIVPYARGREQSRSMEDVFNECEKLVNKGCREITLVGQTVNSYGKSGIDKLQVDFNKFEDPFVELLTRINQLSEKGLNRLRFSSPHPRDFTDALINAHATLKTLTPHIHLPVQSGDDKMLQKMNRKYTSAHYKTIIEKFRTALPGCSVTTDIIVGFCGETEEQFENSYSLYKDLRFDMAYIARYSPRPGTVSVKAFKDDVPREEKARRWHKLNDIIKECAGDYHQSLKGKTLEVLVESHNPKTGECEGRSRENKVVQFAGSPDMIGTIHNIKITKALQWVVKG